jgi:hypothetical protein
MSKLFLEIDINTIKLIDRDLLSTCLTKKGTIHTNKITKISDMLIKEIENVIPESMSSQFIRRKINIQVDYNNVRNTIIFIINWKEQRFKKHCNYEVIHDFNNFFIPEFKNVIKGYNENLRKRTKYYTNGFYY